MADKWTTVETSLVKWTCGRNRAQRLVRPHSKMDITCQISCFALLYGDASVKSIHIIRWNVIKPILLNLSEIDNSVRVHHHSHCTTSDLLQSSYYWLDKLTSSSAQSKCGHKFPMHKRNQEWINAIEGDREKSFIHAELSRLDYLIPMNLSELAFPSSMLTVMRHVPRTLSNIYFIPCPKLISKLTCLVYRKRDTTLWLG